MNVPEVNAEASCQSVIPIGRMIPRPVPVADFELLASRDAGWLRFAASVVT